jgi:pilus assembly protein CpaB
MKRQTIVLIASMALAAITAIWVFTYTSGAENRALADQSTVTALITKAVVPVGTTLQAAVINGSIEMQNVSSAGIPAGTITAVDESNAQLLTLAELSPGQFVLGNAVGTALPQVGPLQIPGGQVAVSLQLNDPQHVGTFVRPTSRIAIFNTEGLKQATGVGVTRLILNNVQVIAVGSATGVAIDPSTDLSSPNALVTVAVSPQDAATLIDAAQTGSPYLALMNNAPSANSTSLATTTATSSTTR